MDSQRFDQWVRSLSSFGSSRRDVAKFLGGGMLSVVLASFGQEKAAARCVKPGRTCRKKNGDKWQCCGSAKCRGKTCKCPQGRDACGKKCCPKGELCVGGGRCVTGQGTCPRGADTCTGGVPILCNSVDFCVCVARLEGGTRCGQGIVGVSAADQCASDDDCRRLGLPPGSSCIRDEGPNCLSTNPARGTCAAPCGSVPPPDGMALLARGAL